MATISDGLRTMNASVARDVAVQSLLQSTEAGVRSGNFDQIAQSMAAAYALLKDNPQALDAFRDSLRNELKDDHFVVKGKTFSDGFGITLHKEGTETGLEAYVHDVADGQVETGANSYDWVTKQDIDQSPEETAQSLAADYDPVVEAQQALAFMKDLPPTALLDEDHNGMISKEELEANKNYPGAAIAVQYMLDHFEQLTQAATSERAQIDMANQSALAQFPELREALEITQRELGERPLTEANIEAAKRQLTQKVDIRLTDPAMASVIEENLDKVLANFDSLSQATAGISEADRTSAAVSAAVEVISGSILRAAEGADPAAPFDMRMLMKTADGGEMAEQLPAIVEAVNARIAATPFRLRTESRSQYEGPIETLKTSTLRLSHLNGRSVYELEITQRNPQLRAPS